jgi:hypothetical protein
VPQEFDELALRSWPSAREVERVAQDSGVVGGAIAPLKRVALGNLAKKLSASIIRSPGRSPATSIRSADSWATGQPTNQARALEVVRGNVEADTQLPPPRMITLRC